MNNRVHPRSTKWKGACAKECVGNSSQWITVTKETRWNDHGSHDLMTCPRIGTTLKAWLKDPSLPMCTIKNQLANKHSWLAGPELNMKHQCELANQVFAVFHFHCKNQFVPVEFFGSLRQNFHGLWNKCNCKTVPSLQSFGQKWNSFVAFSSKLKLFVPPFFQWNVKEWIECITKHLNDKIQQNGFLFPCERFQLQCRTGKHWTVKFEKPKSLHSQAIATFPNSHCHPSKSVPPKASHPRKGLFCSCSCFFGSSLSAKAGCRCTLQFQVALAFGQTT